ncbi:hypothetical protein C8R44DRAFT_750511 [Mycena epipterygia]|nr:hypothetical protein C8R44DRAFT_750511 [Mycena epipterygia]
MPRVLIYHYVGPSYGQPDLVLTPNSLRRIAQLAGAEMQRFQARKDTRLISVEKYQHTWKWRKGEEEVCSDDEEWAWRDVDAQQRVAGEIDAGGRPREGRVVLSRLEAAVARAKWEAVHAGGRPGKAGEWAWAVGGKTVYRRWESDPGTWTGVLEAREEGPSLVLLQRHGHRASETGVGERCVRAAGGKTVYRRWDGDPGMRAGVLEAREEGPWLVLLQRHGHRASEIRVGERCARAVGGKTVYRRWDGDPGMRAGVLEAREEGPWLVLLQSATVSIYSKCSTLGLGFPVPSPHIEPGSSEARPGPEK